MQCSVILDSFPLEIVAKRHLLKWWIFSGWRERIPLHPSMLSFPVAAVDITAFLICASTLQNHLIYFAMKTTLWTTFSWKKYTIINTHGNCYQGLMWDLNTGLLRRPKPTLYQQLHHTGFSVPFQHSSFAFWTQALRTKTLVFVLLTNSKRL